MYAPEANLAFKTTTKLLDALRDFADEPSWAQIDSRFRPVIVGLSRRLGLSQTEAEDVAQQTLSEFVRAYREGRYDRTKGRLSSWILGIAHHWAVRARRRAGREGPMPAEGLASVSEDPELRSIWRDERDRCILARAIAALRDQSDVDDRTLLAFELAALRGVPVSEAALQAGMSVDQVYVAKSRLTRRLRSCVEELTAAFEEDA
ncbi:MAG: hypothetical protein JNM07_08300 [Phycisphaerae bacterium]|nr:hypothetical protein [Phycisphaerae bacterium]